MDKIFRYYFKPILPAILQTSPHPPVQLHITHLVRSSVRPSGLPVEQVLYSATAVFWSTILSVVLLTQCVVCLTFSIVAKRYVLAKNCLKEQIGNLGQKVDFLGHRHISTSGFASTATKTAVLPYFCPYSPAIGTRWYKWTF